MSSVYRALERYEILYWLVRKDVQNNQNAYSYLPIEDILQATCWVITFQPFISDIPKMVDNT